MSDDQYPVQPPEPASGFEPTTAEPATAEPATAEPTAAEPTTAEPTTAEAPFTASDPTPPVPTGSAAYAGVRWAQPAAPDASPAATGPYGVPLASPVIETPGGSGGRRGLVVVGAVAAVAVLGVGGALAYQAVLGGGGAQPESALPSTTVAFVKVDLDPAGSQKVDAIRFLRKFPELKAKIASEDTDLRKAIVDAVQDEGVLTDVDYATDIEPWLGQRFGVGVIPGAEGADPTVAVVLAVTDEGKARESISRLADSSESACSVGSEYAVCAHDQAQLDAVLAATEQGSLAGSADFAKDMDALGEDGIAAAWGDLGRARSVLAAAVDASGAPVDLPEGSLDRLQGRGVMALRFDGPHLELAGRAIGLGSEVQLSTDTTSVANLPADTLATLSVAGLGTMLDQAWPQVQEQFGDGGTLEQLEQQTGFSLPEDLVKALGSHLSVAFGGMDAGEPRVALVTDGDRDVLDLIVDQTSAMFGAPQGAVTLVEDGEESVLALSPEYADEVKNGSGLADSQVFKDAVPHADGSQVVLFADIAGLSSAMGAEDLSGDAAAAKSLSALGLSVQRDGEDATFTLRLSTR